MCKAEETVVGHKEITDCLKTAQGKLHTELKDAFFDKAVLYTSRCGGVLRPVAAVPRQK